ncbi:MAG: hypothetical protein JKX71_12925 [Amylibacter sp.]|nr:hypothetical protein [Amylibacter sp.]
MAKLTVEQKAKAAEAAKLKAEEEAKAQAEADAAKLKAEDEAKAQAEAKAADAAKLKAEEEAKAKSGAKFTTVVVIGPKQGRWRIGRHFGPDQTSIPLEDLSEDDKQALHDDPVLAISII